MSERLSNLFGYDFSKGRDAARKRAYDRFSAAIGDGMEPLDVEDRYVSDDELEMLAAAGQQHAPEDFGNKLN